MGERAKTRVGGGRVLVVLALLSGMILWVPGPVDAPPGTWVSELVDGSVDVGEYNALAFNRTGAPHIAYRRIQPFPSGVLHAWKVAGTWQNEEIFTDAGVVGRYVSLAIDSADRLHVSFFANDVLYYATNATGSWVSVIADEDPTAIVGWYTSIAVDSLDHPRIAYYDQGNQALKYAYFDGVAWTVEVVDTSATDDAGRYCSLAVGPGDVPHISYFYRTSAGVGQLRHAWKPGASWGTEIVTTVNYPGQHSSIAVDALGGVHVSHYLLTTRDLAYSYNGGTGWSTSVVASTGDVGSYTSIALDAGGEPHIAHVDKTANQIDRTWREAAVWSTEPAVSPGVLANPGSLSLKVPSDNRPRLSYYDAANADQRYAEAFLDFVDLAVVDVGLDPVGPYVPGTPVLTCANVTNLGTQGSGAFVVRFTDGDPDGGAPQIGTDQSVAVLAPGAYANVCVSWTAGPVGAHRIFAEANPDDAVPDPFQGNDKSFEDAVVIGPDLEIAPGDVTLVPPPPLAEGTVSTLGARIANIGPVNATNVLVRFYDGNPSTGGVPIGADRVLPTLNASEVLSVSVPWMAVPVGIHVLFAVADPDSAIEELAEANNRANLTAIVSRSDLAVTAADIRPTPPLRQGVPGPVEVDVRNVGPVDASAVRVDLYQGDPGAGGVPIDAPQTLPSVPAGGLATATFTWTPPAPGAFGLYVRVDPLDAIPELEEGNNAANATVTVSAIADLTVEGVALSPSPPIVSAPVAVNATLGNLGALDATANVTFFLDGDGDRVADSGEVFALAPYVFYPAGGTAWAVGTWTPGAIGTFDVCARADAEDLVGEANESNNVLCAMAPVVGRPDYVPVEPLPASPARVGVGTLVSLSVKVRNQGNGTAPGVSTIAFYNATTPGSPFHSETVSPVAPGNSSSVVGASWLAPSAPGFYGVTVAVDFGAALDEWEEGNNAYTWTIEVSAAPITTLVYGTPRNGTAPVFVTSATPLSLTVQDFSGTGVLYTRYQVDGGGWAVYSAPFTLSGEGPHTVEFYSEDNLGNVEPINAANPVVDDTPPTTSVALGSPSYLVGGTWIAATTPVSLAAVDGPAQPVGLDTISYRVWNGASWTPWATYAAPLTFPLEGAYAMEHSATDGLGNAEAVSVATFAVDATPPAPSATFGTPIVAGTPPWISGTTPVSANATDGGVSPVGLSSVAYRVWRQGAWAGWTAGPATVPLRGPDGLVYVEVRAVDRLGNTGMANASAIVDVSPPETTADVGAPKYVGAYTFVAPATPIALVATDPGPDAVGLLETTYRVWRGGWSAWTAFVVPFALGAGDGLVYLEYASEDLLENREAVGNATFVVDETDPILEIRIDGPTFLAGNGTLFAAGNVTLVLTAADPGTWASGVDFVVYAFDSGAWTSAPGPVSLAPLGHGTHRIDVRAADHLGHAVSVELRFFLDVRAPRTTLEVQRSGGEASLLFSATDDGSGVNATFYSLDGDVWRRYEGAIPVLPGDHVLGYYSSDQVGNVEAVEEYTFTVAGPVAPPRANAKPLLAAIFAVLLVGLGFFLSRRTRSRRFLAWAATFAVAEVGTGVASLVLPGLAIPPVLGAGLVVDLGILLAGLATLWTLARRVRGPDASPELEEGEEPEA